MAGAEVKARIRGQALSLGFSDIGFTGTEGASRWGADLDQWLAEGRHGDMGWMETTRDRRARPVDLWSEARGVIVLALSFAPPGDPPPPDRGAICAYARARDYHDTVKPRLKALARWIIQEFGGDVKVFVDTAPVMEKPLAEAAGLGWQGRHTNLVSRRLGGWFVLGEIFTTLELAPDPPAINRCGGCRACVDACPTNALDGTGRLEPRRCLGYLGIEFKGGIPEDLRELWGNRVYGCDACVAACPWNKFARPPRLTDVLPRIEWMMPRLADLAALDEAEFRLFFAGSPVKRLGWGRFLRNVLIAIGNSGCPDLADAAGRHQTDPDPGIAEAAAWAVKRLRPPEG